MAGASSRAKRRYWTPTALRPTLDRQGRSLSTVTATCDRDSRMQQTHAPGQLEAWRQRSGRHDLISDHANLTIAVLADVAEYRERPPLRAAVGGHDDADGGADHTRGPKRRLEVNYLLRTYQSIAL